MFANPQYCCLLIVQLLLLLLDILINSFSLQLINISLIGMLVMSIVQDVVILLMWITLLLGFFNTFAFTAGLIKLIIRKYIWTLGFGVVYLIMSLSYHIWILTSRWNNTGEYVWNEGLQIYYVIHKLITLYYYYLYKRAIYRLSDPKLYSDSQWMRTHMNIH